jgi:hypothetical protein
MRRETASFVAVTADTLVLVRTLYVPHDPVAQPDTVRTRIPLGAVERLEVRARGTAAFVVPGALAGLAVGATVGASIGRHSGYSPCGFWFVFCFEESPGDKATIYGILGGGIGMGVGGLLGALPFFERWRSVPPERLRLSLAPARGGGVRLRLSCPF